MSICQKAKNTFFIWLFWNIHNPNCLKATIFPIQTVKLSRLQYGLCCNNLIQTDFQYGLFVTEYSSISNDWILNELNAGNFINSISYSSTEQFYNTFKAKHFVNDALLIKIRTVYFVFSSYLQRIAGRRLFKSRTR